MSGVLTHDELDAAIALQQKAAAGDKAPSAASAASPGLAVDAVMVKSAPIPAGTPVVRGYDFNEGIDFSALLATYKYMGIQAANLGLAVDEVNRMVRARASASCKTLAFPHSATRARKELCVKAKRGDETTSSAVELLPLWIDANEV